MRKIPFAGIELTSQRVRGLRGTSEATGVTVSDVQSINRCLLKFIELPEVFWCCTCISGSQGIGPGFSGAARFSLSRRAHVKAKGTLDSVKQKNSAVGEQKVGQPRRPTSCVLSFVEAENWAGVVQRARLVLWRPTSGVRFSWRPANELDSTNPRIG